MALISASVGRLGQNRESDTRVVQRLLNRHLHERQQSLTVDGIAGARTIEAIVDFQRRVVGLRTPDGRVDPGGKTLRQLNRGAEADAAPTLAVVGAPLTGAAWWRANQARYPNSTRLEDLDGRFRENCCRFIAALQEAGASVVVSSTRRNRVRAHLMHYSWRVSRGEVRPSDVPGIDDLALRWDHGHLKASIEGAREMADLFGLVHVASLTSNHIRGVAVDMTIGWHGVLSMSTPSHGSSVTIRVGPRDGSNVELQRVGSLYGVKKLRSDPPHWSIDGR